MFVKHVFTVMSPVVQLSHSLSHKFFHMLWFISQWIGLGLWETSDFFEVSAFLCSFADLMIVVTGSQVDNAEYMCCWDCREERKTKYVLVKAVAE